MVCIVLNIVIMAMGYETATNEYNFVIKQINLVFTSIFILECILKLLAYGI